MIARAIFIFLGSTIFISGTSAQNTIGLPDIVNYSKLAYGAGSQNWDIKQDVNGVMYYANNEGLLSFDGQYWRLYPMPNKTIVRSLEIGDDHRIYVGAQDELGYFAPAENGHLRFHSLKHLLPKKEQSFTDLWDIVNYDGDIFFRTTNRIFQFSEGQMNVYSTNSWLFLGQSNGVLIAQDYKNDLMIFSKGTWSPHPASGKMPDDYLVTGFFSINKDSSVIATYKHGLFLFTGHQITPIVSPGLSFISTQLIYSAIHVGPNQIALGTVLEGCFIVNYKGELIQSFSRPNGLQNNNVLCLFKDRQKNLWMALDNGIDLVTYSQAIKHIYPQNQNESSGYASLVYKNQLYIGTSNGLYRAPLTPAEDLSYVKSDFEPVENTRGQVWNLSEVNGHLLLGHHEGAFLVENKTVKPLVRQIGFWNFFALSRILPSPLVVAGTYEGLQIFQFNNGSFTPVLKANFESARFLAITDEQTVWFSHPYKGLFKVSLSANNPPNIRNYNQDAQLGGVNDVLIYRNKLLAATDKGIFEYQADKDSFTRSPFFLQYFGNLSIRYLKEDSAGNLWFIHEKRMGVLDFAGTEPELVYIPELDFKMVSGFEHIYPLNQKNVFVGAEKGFYLINYEEYRKRRPELSVHIRSVTISGPSDSLLFGGYFKQVNELQVQPTAAIPKIHHNYNAVHFEYSANYYGNQLNMEYSYHLKGFDQHWSEWSKKSEKDYSNLPSGTYTFQVKARNNLGVESAIGAYSLVVSPPWYLSNWAYLFYLLVIGILIYLLNRHQKRKFLNQQRKHAEEQKRLQYLHQLEMEKTEKEIVKLKNEKLEAEIAHKNTELATTAMHLVQKGELLSRVKTDLSRQMKNVIPEKDAAELKRMVKVLVEDEKMDQDWENFAQHFDQVQGDYLGLLKEKHPNLSANELKLCAYLRMSLSSKEIAPLLNISVRGVEISRYRLRKKLGIPTEINLFDYLMAIQKKKE